MGEALCGTGSSPAEDIRWSVSGRQGQGPKMDDGWHKHLLWGLLQCGLDEVLGICTEMGSCGAAPRHPPLEDVQKGGTVTLTSKWG